MSLANGLCSAGGCRHKLSSGRPPCVKWWGSALALCPPPFPSGQCRWRLFPGTDCRPCGPPTVYPSLATHQPRSASPLTFRNQYPPIKLLRHLLLSCLLSAAVKTILTMTVHPQRARCAIVNQSCMHLLLEVGSLAVAATYACPLCEGRGSGCCCHLWAATACLPPKGNWATAGRVSLDSLNA